MSLIWDKEQKREGGATRYYGVRKPEMTPKKDARMYEVFDYDGTTHLTVHRCTNNRGRYNKYTFIGIVRNVEDGKELAAHIDRLTIPADELPKIF